MQVKDSKLIVMKENVQTFLDLDSKILGNIKLKATLPYFITQLYDDQKQIITNKYSVISANIVDSQQMYFVTLTANQFVEYQTLPLPQQEVIQSLKLDDDSVERKRFNNPQNISVNGQQALDNIKNTSESYDKNKDSKMRVPRLNDQDQYVDEKNNVITLNADKSNIEYELIDQNTYDTTWKVKHANFIKTNPEYNKWTTMLEQDKQNMKQNYASNLGIQAGSPEEKELNDQVDKGSDAKSMMSYALKMNHASDTYQSMFAKHENSLYYIEDVTKDLDDKMKVIDLHNINSYAKRGQTYNETSKALEDVNIDTTKQRALINLEILKYEKENNTNYFIDQILTKVKNLDLTKYQNQVPNVDLALKVFKLKWANKAVITTKQYKNLINNFDTIISEVITKNMNNQVFYNDIDNVYYSNHQNGYYRKLGVDYINNIFYEDTNKKLYINNFLKYKLGVNWKTQASFNKWLTWFESDIKSPSLFNDVYAKSTNYNLKPKTSLTTTLALIEDDKTKRRQKYQRFDYTTYNKQIVVDLKATNKQNYKFNVSNETDNIIFEIEYDNNKQVFTTKTMTNGVEETNIKQNALISDIKVMKYLENKQTLSLVNLENTGYYYTTSYEDENKNKIFEDVTNFNGFDKILAIPEKVDATGTKTSYDYTKIEITTNNETKKRVITLKEKSQTNFKNFVYNYNVNGQQIKSVVLNYQQDFIETIANDYKIKEIQCSSTTDTKTYEITLISNTNTYLINPDNWDNQNRVSLLTNIQLVDQNMNPTHTIEENVVIEKYKDSITSYDVILNNNEHGQLNVKYVAKTQMVSCEIKPNNVNLIQTYVNMQVKNLYVIGNDNNDYLIDNVYKTQQLSKVLVDKQRYFNFVLNVTNKEDTLLAQISKVIDITYTTYDQEQIIHYKTYIIKLRYDVSKRVLKIDKIYEDGKITGDIKVTINAVNIQWSDENPDNKHKTIDYSGTHDQVQTSIKEHLKYIVKDSILNVWDEDYFNYRLDKQQTELKISDLEQALQDKINAYFSTTNQQTKSMTLQQMLDECLKLATTRSQNLEKLQNLENLKYMFIEEDMHNKIALEECKNYDIIIVDKIRQIIHDTDFKELTQGYKDQIYNQLDNLDTHQNVEVVQQALEQIMQDVTTKIQNVNAKYHDDQTNLRIYVNYTEPKTTRDIPYQPVTSSSISTPTGYVEAYQNTGKGRPSKEIVKDTKNTIGDAWSIGVGILSVFGAVASLPTLGVIGVAAASIGLVSSIVSSHIATNIMTNGLHINDNTTNMIQSTSNYIGMLSGFVGIGNTAQAYGAHAGEVLTDVKNMGRDFLIGAATN